jgi:O-Antigen ligase
LAPLHFIMTSSNATVGLDRDHGWTAVVTKFLMTAFVIELVLGGPGYWLVAGISVRRSLVALVTIWMLGLCIAGKLRLRFGHLWLVASITVFISTWVILIPSLNGPAQLADGIQEGIPLALLLSGVLAHAYYRDNWAAWVALRKVAAGSLIAAAILALVAWIAGTFFVEDGIIVAIAFASYFTLGNDSLAPSLYVQTMPDGFFRVMWITSTVFITGLLYSLRTGRQLLALLFALALFVSYTRALWLCAAIGIVYAVIVQAMHGRAGPLRLRRMATLVLAFASLVAVDLARGGDESVTTLAVGRLFATFTDESASERAEQIDPLVDAWLAAPLFGSGLGSAAAVSRSDVAPYLYELTYLALLMKIGLVGLFLVSTLIFFLLVRPLPRGTAAPYVDAGIIAFLLACASNPFLLNLVGLGLLCFLFIERDMLSLHVNRSGTYPEMVSINSTALMPLAGRRL